MLALQRYSGVVRRSLGRLYSHRTNNVDCYISTSHDPYINLAIEEWLLRETDPARHILYLWRNAPCVVIGRNQNPFLECNLHYMDAHAIPLVRRRSGGGTVYHDMGNALYTIFMPRESFSRNVNAELVARALQQLDIPAGVNERHDIAIEDRKVSGSAYKIIAKRAYHHGTMLIDADMTSLRGCLSRRKSGIVSKGVASVPSPVTNLREHSYTVDHQQFNEAVLDEFVSAYHAGRPVQPILLDEHDLEDRVLENAQELRTWDWIFGQTPEFTNQCEHEFHWGHVRAVLTCRHGIITEADLTTTSVGVHEVTVVSALAVALRGCRYSVGAVQDATQKIKAEIPGLIGANNHSLVRDLEHWLRHHL